MVGGAAYDDLLGNRELHTFYDGNYVGKCYSGRLLGNGSDTTVYRVEYISLAAGKRFVREVK